MEDINSPIAASETRTPTFDQFFLTTLETDPDLVRGALGRIKVDQRFGPLVDKWEYSRAKESGRLKYSDEQLAGAEWDSDDIELALAEARNEKITTYFHERMRRYEGMLPISDSIVRLDQEDAIAADLDEGRPILIRGNWRLGKTSMLRSLVTHKYGQANSLYIDASTESSSENVDVNEFTKRFGLYAISEFIADSESHGLTGEQKYAHEDAIRDKILASGMNPLEYLNSHLQEHDKKVFLGLDEVIALQRHPGMLEYVAKFKDLSNIKLVVVLHRYQLFEEEFEQVFGEFTTHFIRSLRPEEVADLVRKPLEGSEVTFTDDAIPEIVSFTGSRPMEVQNVCMALLDPNSKHPNLKLSYTAQDVRMLDMLNTWELERAGFGSAIRTYRQIFQNSMSSEERDVVRRLCESETIACDQIDTKLVQPLINTTYVVKDEESNTYRINGGLFKKVVQEIIEYETEDEE